MPKEMAKGEKHYLSELKEMIAENDSKDVNKVFAVFCQRHGISMDDCRKYYDKLDAKDKVKK